MIRIMVLSVPYLITLELSFIKIVKLHYGLPTNDSTFSSMMMAVWFAVSQRLWPNKCSKTTEFTVIKKNFIFWRTTFLKSNTHSYSLDRANDNMAYESLGPWSRMMEDSRGSRYRVWKYTDKSTGTTIHEKYPFNWEDYFARPSVYPQTPLGRFSFDVQLLNLVEIFKFLH